MAVERRVGEQSVPSSDTQSRGRVKRPPSCPMLASVTTELVAWPVPRTDKDDPLHPESGEQLVVERRG